MPSKKIIWDKLPGSHGYPECIYDWYYCSDEKIDIVYLKEEVCSAPGWYFSEPFNCRDLLMDIPEGCHGPFSTVEEAKKLANQWYNDNK